MTPASRSPIRHAGRRLGGRGEEALAALRRWGFTTLDVIARARTVGEITRYHRRLGERRERLDYEIDGIVLKVNALAVRRRLGAA